MYDQQTCFLPRRGLSTFILLEMPRQRKNTICLQLYIPQTKHAPYPGDTTSCMTSVDRADEQEWMPPAEFGEIRKERCRIAEKTVGCCPMYFRQTVTPIGRSAVLCMESAKHVSTSKKGFCAFSRFNSPRYQQQ